MICAICGETIVEGVVENVLNAEARKVIHRATKHDPVLGFVLVVAAWVAIAWSVPRLIKAVS